MTAALIPFATWRPVSYRAAAGTFAAPPLGWVLHVVVGNGSPYGTFENAPAGSRRFSHLWVAKDGTCEQYAELTTKSWAQAAGNGLYWSVETEGFPAEALTDAQITTLARIHNFLGAADAVVDAVGGKGIGTHVMGGAAWGGHSCPGPGPRAGQRAAIIAKAKALRAPVTPVAPKPPASDVPPVFTKPTPVPTPAPKPPAPKPPAVAPAVVLRLGSKGAAVQRLQLGLNRVFPAYSHLVVDGNFGAKTAAVIHEFQRRTWPSTPSAWDDVVGSNTRAALKRSGITF